MQSARVVDNYCFNHIQVLDLQVFFLALLVLVGIDSFMQFSKGGDLRGDVVDLGEVAGLMVT